MDTPIRGRALFTLGIGALFFREFVWILVPHDSSELITVSHKWNLCAIRQSAFPGVSSLQQFFKNPGQLPTVQENVDTKGDDVVLILFRTQFYASQFASVVIHYVFWYEHGSEIIPHLL